LLLCRDPSGKHPDIVFFDTNVMSSATDIIERYAARFSIELTNRETKQLLGAAEPSVPHGKIRHPCSNVCILVLLVRSPVVRQTVL